MKEKLKKLYEKVMYCSFGEFIFYLLIEIVFLTFLFSVHDFIDLKRYSLIREQEKDCIKYYIDNDGYTLQNCNEYTKKLEEFK